MTAYWEKTLPKGTTIIVVEDEEPLCHLITEVFEEMGADCMCFQTADMALAHLDKTEGRCSLAILDHGVPGNIHGTELLCVIKARWPAMPVILTSGYALTNPFPNDAVYLQKPWSIDTLNEMAWKMLQGQPL